MKRVYIRSSINIMPYCWKKKKKTIKTSYNNACKIDRHCVKKKKGMDMP